MPQTKDYTPQTGGKFLREEPTVQRELRDKIAAHFGTRLVETIPHSGPHGLSYIVTADNALEVFRELRDDKSFRFEMLVDVTCVDWLDQRDKRFEVIYHLLSYQLQTRVCLRIEVDEDQPEVESVRSLWSAANFLEREVWDLFGIKFKNHGDLRRILMYDEFVGHPLRKDYPIRGKQPRVPLRIPELRNTSQDMRKEQLVSLPTRQRFSPASE